jgi:hypothetical protein
MSKEKDWPMHLGGFLLHAYPITASRFPTYHVAGMLDWDDTNIVFTKRSLVEFLK